MQIKQQQLELQLRRLKLAYAGVKRVIEKEIVETGNIASSALYTNKEHLELEILDIKRELRMVYFKRTSF